MPGLLEETKAAGGAAEEKLITEEQMQDLQRVDVSGRFYCGVKRTLDFVLSIIGLTVLLVPIVLIALVVYIDDPGNVSLPSGALSSGCTMQVIPVSFCGICYEIYQDNCRSLCL